MQRSWTKSIVLLFAVAIVASVALLFAVFLSADSTRAGAAGTRTVSTARDLAIAMVSAEEGDTVQLSADITFDLTDSGFVSGLYPGATVNGNLYLANDGPMAAHDQTLDLNGHTLTIKTGNEECCIQISGMDLKITSSLPGGEIVGMSSGSLASVTGSGSISVSEVLVRNLDESGGDTNTDAAISADSGSTVTIGANVSYDIGSGAAFVSGVTPSGSAQQVEVVTTATELATELEEGGNVLLGADITSDESLFFERDVTLDMNGYELTVAKATTHPVVIDGANVTIVDGNITVGKGVYANRNAILVTNRATLTLGTKSDETVVEDDGVFVTTNSGYGIVVSGGAALNMYGGSVTAKWCALGTNNTTGTAAFNVYGATLESTDDSAIFMSCYTDVYLKETAVIGKTAIDIRIGNLTVDGGSITSTYDGYHEMTYDEVTASGTLTGGDGSAILVKANYYYDNANKSNEVSIVISETTEIKGAVTIYDLDGVGNMLDGKENVTDQTVNLQTFVDELKTSHASVETHLYDVAPADGSGDGTIVDVDKVHADAGEQVTAIVSSSDELRAAFAEDYDTVKLGADLEISGNRIEIGDISDTNAAARSITLDLNGHKLTIGTIDNPSTAALYLGYNVSLTLTDTAGNGSIDASNADDLTVPVGAMRSGSTLTVESGTIIVDTDRESCVFAMGGGKIVIKGGTFINNCTSDYAYGGGKPLTVNIANNSASTIDISGGTFKGRNPMSGDDNTDVAFVSQDSKVVEYKDGNMTVVGKDTEVTGEDIVAVYTYADNEAGDTVATVYTEDTLRAALAEDNYDTVKLGADIQYISKVFVIDRPVTLDLADNILSTTSGYVLEITSSNVTVTGSVLSGEHTNTNTQIRGTIGIHINGTGVADGIKDIRIENIRIYTTSTVKSSCSVNIESADYVTLDNVTIRSSADCVRAWKGSENVTVTNSDLTTDGENDPNAIELLSNSSMTVTDSKITANGYGGAGIFIGTDDGGSSDNVAARLKVDGTTIISADAFGITGNGTQHGTYIEITDNAVITCTNFAVYHPQKGELKISGNAKITGASGIEMRAGTLIVTGTPTVTATDETYDESPLNDGPRFAGVALGVSRYFAGSENGVTLDIRGGTFKAKDGGYAFCEKDIAVTDAEDNRDLSFDGATFEGRLSSQNETGFIKSGTFTKGVELDYIEAGRQAGVKADGGMEVASTISGEGYDAIYDVSDNEGESTTTATVYTADALNDAVSAGVDVVLGCDITADVVVPKDVAVTLDLNGHTLTNSSNHTIINYGTLAITDGSAYKRGTVDNVTHGRGALVNYGVATLSGGTFTRSKEASTSSSDGNGNSWYTLKNYCEMTIDEGVTVTTGSSETSTGEYSSLISNGFQSKSDYNSQKDKVTTTNRAKLTINGGKFSGGLNTEKNDGVYSDDDHVLSSTLIITGGEFTNTAQHVILNYGDAKISGGTFDAPSASAAIWNVASAGDASYSKTLGKADITGGTFNGGTYGIVGMSGAQITVSGNTSVKGEYAVVLNGNTTKAELKGGTYDGALFEQYADTLSVSSGTFDSAFDLDLLSQDCSLYIAEGGVYKAGSSGTSLGDKVLLVAGDKGYASEESAASDGVVAIIGTNGYGNVQSAVNAAASDETVKLIGDVTINDDNAGGKLTLTYADGSQKVYPIGILINNKNITLDLAGHTVTLNTAYGIYGVGNFTLTSSGETRGEIVAGEGTNAVSVTDATNAIIENVNVKGGATAPTTNLELVSVSNSSLKICNSNVTLDFHHGGTSYQGQAISTYNSDLTLNGVIVHAESGESSYGIAFRGTYDTNALKEALQNSTTITYKTLTIKNSEIYAQAFAVSGNGALHGTVFNITDSKLKGIAGAAIYHPQYGEMTIGGTTTIEGASGIEMRAGKLVIESGNVNVTATGDFTVDANGNGSTASGVAVAVSQHTTELPINVVIRDGTYSATGEDGKAFYETDTVSASPDSDDVTFALQGGNYTAPVVSENKTSFVSGGTFSQVFDSKYLSDSTALYIPTGDGASGYVVAPTSGAPEGASVVAAVMDGKGYASISAAIAAINDTEQHTITLVDLDGDNDNIVTGEGVFLGAGDKNIVIDFNGLTYNVNTLVGSAGTESQLFHLEKGNTVTLKNGKIGVDEAVSKDVGMFIQNYSYLTLDGMTVGSSAFNDVSYTVSNNNCSLTVTGDTTIKAADGKVAFDVWYGMYESYYDGVTVTFDEGFTGTVIGKVEYGAATATSEWMEKTKIEFNSPDGVFDIDIDMSKNVPDATDANINVESGTFSKGVDLAYVADGQKVGVKPGGGMEVGSEISGEGFDAIYTVSGDENASMSAIVYTADMFKKALDNDSVTEITLGKDFGGSYTIDRDVTIKAADGVTFSGNIVIESSSVTRTTGANVTLEGVAFKGNGSGTAISVKNGSLTMTGGSITNYDNGIVAGTRGGAAVDISVDNVEFTELDEKGIYGEAFGDLTVKNSTFNGAGNDASGAGNPYTGRSAAAIDINQTVAGGSVSITGNTFVDCGDNGPTSGAIKIKVRNIPVEQSYGQAGDFAAEHNELVGSFEAVSVTNNTFTNCSRDIVVGTGYVAKTYVDMTQSGNKSYESDGTTTRDLIFVDNAHVDDAESLMNAFADEDLVLIEVFANITTTDIIVVDKPGKSVVLDLNGYTITANDTTTSTENGVSIGAGFLYLADGTLTVKDGTVNAIEDSFRVQTEATDDYAKLILADDLTVTSQNANAVYIRALNQQESTTPNAVLETAADLKVSGKYAAIQGNGTSTDGPVSVTVTGGDIVADPADETIDGTGLYLPGRGEYLITGGTITAPTGVEFRAGTLTITGGTITATGEFAADPNGNGATTSGVAVAMMQHTTERDLTLNITGGEFNGAYAVYQQNIQNNDSGTLTMSLTGGTFNGSVDSENCAEYISGGQYSVKPAAEAFKPGFDGVEYDGYYVVIETTTDDIAALLAARIDAQADVRTYAAVLGIDWKAMEALVDTDDVAAAALDAYNAIGNATSEGYVAIARSAAMDALDAYAAAMAESELEAAKLKAQTTVKMYIASADIGGWTNLLLIKQDGVKVEKEAVAPIFAMYDMIEKSTTVADIDAYMWKAISQVDTYVNALENWRKAAADEVTAAAQETAENANDAVVVPTSVYAAINGAVNYTEVNTYKTNALAEIADIRAYRADIAEQGSELDLIYGTLTEFKNAFDALDASLTGENNAFVTLLKDVQDAITTAQNAITGGTDESSESLASIKSYLENTIYNAITAAQNAITSAIASVRTDIDALETALAGYESDFEGLSGTLAQINSSLGGKIDAAQAYIDAIKRAIDALGTPASAAAVTELATAIDELKAAVNEISVSVSAPSAVETVKTEATADIAEWLNAYVDEIVNSVTASNGKAYAAAVTFAPALETTDGDLYAKLLKAFDKDNADLVLKYYNDALTAIDAATTADEVNTAVATFKAQVASVEAASGNTSDLTVVYVLLIVVLVVLVVAVVVAAVLSRKRRVPVGYAPAPTPAPAPATSETTEQTEKAALAEKPEVTDDTAATAVETAEAPDEDAGERVVINASVKTFDEAYDEMSDTLKDMFEKVREYALSKNGATGVRIGNGVRVKRGSKQIVKLTVRRGYPVAMFVLENEMLKDYRRTAGSSAKLKVPATELVLREPSDLDAAYMMVDLAVRQLDADVEAAKERRRELLRERRRQRREAMEAAKAAQAAQAEATTEPEPDATEQPAAEERAETASTEQAVPTATEQAEAGAPEPAVDEDKTE